MAVWQNYLWSAIIAVAISCLRLMIVFENKFSAIISQTQTICDCNRPPFALLKPAETVRVQGYKGDGCYYCDRWRLKSRRQSVAVWQSRPNTPLSYQSYIFNF